MSNNNDYLMMFLMTICFGKFANYCAKQKEMSTNYFEIHVYQWNQDFPISDRTLSTTQWVNFVFLALVIDHFDVSINLTSSK